MINKAYFELDENILTKNFQKLEDSLSLYWPNYKIGYSYKTNSLPWFISWMKKNGALAEVVSSPEFELARRINYECKDIILNGPNKGNFSLKKVLDGGGVVNLDGFQEISWIKENLKNRKKNWEVGLRINFDLENSCPGETIMGNEPGRFGFNVENGDFMKAIKILNKLNGIDVVGIHVHHSTITKSLNIFSNLAKNASELGSNYLSSFKYLDIGGGFYGDKFNAPSYNAYLKTITDELRKYTNINQTSLIIEPGISLAASCFSYICSVLDIKIIKGRHLVMTNGSSMHIDPQMKGRKFDYEISTKEKHEKVNDQIICGYTCIENDRFLNLKNELKLSIGDILKIKNTGAYSLSFTPLFIEYLPKVILKNKKIIREEWGVNEYMQLNYID